VRLYTVGFTQKTAETFFELLRQNGIRRIVDIRLKPQGQLAGFARKGDLPYFLSRLADGCEYVHVPLLAPSKELLDEYRAGLDWSRYVKRFEKLMDARNIPAVLDRRDFDGPVSCLLCSEPAADHCHRRLVAERLARAWAGVNVIHL
jgi:uncharacterized protein (DUF488 family)